MNERDIEVAVNHAYNAMLDNGRCPGASALRAADGVMVTEWMWTGNLYAFARVCRERLAHGRATRNPRGGGRDSGGDGNGVPRELAGDYGGWQR